MRKSKTVLRGWPGAALTRQELISGLLIPAQRTAPGAFPEEDPSDAQVRIGRKRKGAEVKEIWLKYQEVLMTIGLVASRNYPLQFSPSALPFLMWWGWAIYILGICTQGLNGHLS